MTAKPSIPKGTRDFGPDVMARRNLILDTIRQIFRLFGYQPIETPAMENLSTLLGKYGEEGDKLLFRILNSGDFLQDVDLRTINGASALLPYITDKGLRYDLTVPFARFVVQNRNELPFPFKRYQIQPVWRADRPQKGRYREFYQCDADVVGSDALINEAELVQMVDMVFNRLGLRVVVKINNRKILAGIAYAIGQPHSLTEITMAIDKLDKIGIDAVNEELAQRGLPLQAIEALQPVLFMTGDTREKLDKLTTFIGHTPEGAKGIEEMRTLLNYLENSELRLQTEFDLTLARGLNYYTGAIFEVKALDVPMGSICGGGRYDNLTGVFGMPGMSGVGISFGADRIYDVMNELGLFPETSADSTQVLFLNFDAQGERFSLPFVQQLRQQGINTEMYPSAEKLKKQMRYADQKHIPLVVMAGETELQNNSFTIKDMKEGGQQTVDVSLLLATIKALLHKHSGE
ncbi:MAG TPA: histidine--tRNA ligase [Bacteroidales bacterium]|nr:histidine--tRNA ligase [Bacteroidales bacterium]